MRDGAIDPLTELPSRTATLRHLDNVLAAAQRGGGRVGVLFIDLDGFKAINDTFGHAVGDQTLIEAARRMKESVRRNDFVGRLGGDEFVAVLTVVDDELEMVEAAQRFLERVLVEVQEGGFTSLVRASIGIAVSPDDGTTPEQLLQHADEALYAAKESGGNSVRWYRDGVSQEVRARREFRERLRDANFERDFMLCYQPIVSTSTMRVVGAEALVRWRHPSRGWLTPRTFLDFRGGAMASSALDVKVIRAVADTLRARRRTGSTRASTSTSPTRTRSCGRSSRALIRDVDDAREPARARSARSDDARRLRRRRLVLAPRAPARHPDRARRVRRRADLARGDGDAPARLHQDRPPRHQPEQPRTGSGSGSRAPRSASRRRCRSARSPTASRTASRRSGWSQNGVEQLQGYLIAQPMTAPDFADWLRSSRPGVRDAW